LVLRLALKTKTKKNLSFQAHVMVNTVRYIIDASCGILILFHTKFLKKSTSKPILFYGRE